VINTRGKGGALKLAPPPGPDRVKIAINAQSICQLNFFDQVENIFEHSQNILKDNEFYPKD